jgi:hypothetical protein
MITCDDIPEEECVAGAELVGALPGAAVVVGHGELVVGPEEGASVPPRTLTVVKVVVSLVIDSVIRTLGCDPVTACL